MGPPLYGEAAKSPRKPYGFSGRTATAVQSTGTTGGFKVQDGLIFNSVRYGDPVNS
jgi:hypothetical protein